MWDYNDLRSPCYLYTDIEFKICGTSRICSLLAFYIQTLSLKYVGVHGSAVSLLFIYIDFKICGTTRICGLHAINIQTLIFKICGTTLICGLNDIYIYSISFFFHIYQISISIIDRDRHINRPKRTIMSVLIYCQ